MKDIKENNNKVSIFLSTEINEVFSKTTINEEYISQNNSSEIKVLFFIYNNSILKSFKISIGKELFISNENKESFEMNKIETDNKYTIEYDKDKDYCFTINLGMIESNTSISINAVYLNFVENKGNKYFSTLFKRFPLIFIKEDKINKCITHDKIEGDIILKTQNKIEMFVFKNINFNENFVNKETDEDNNEIKDEKISINVLSKQYKSIKELLVKYQLKGLENLKEIEIYEYLYDFIPLIKIIFITQISSTLRRTQIEYINNNQIILLFKQKGKENDNKIMNLLHYKYSFSNNYNMNINDRNDIIIYPNKYLFVIDESVHMAGKKIAKVRGAIKLLLHSLNSNCLYQIIGFNESIRLYDGKFKHSVKSNIIKSLEYLSNIFVDNKKCKLFQIIKLIYYICNQNKNIPINIFLFTNAICDRMEINKSLNIIYQNSSQKNFHLNIFTLGEKFNKYFVVSASLIGNGNYYLLNRIDQLNKCVISELDNCHQEYYSNINQEISKSFILKEYKLENISQKNVSDDNPLNLCFISKNNEEGLMKIKIYYKKYINEKFLLQNTLIKNYEVCDLPLGNELYLLYLYKIFYENNDSLNENVINNDMKTNHFLDNYNINNNYTNFSSFLKKSISKYGIILDNIDDIFVYDNNIKKITLIKKIILNSNNSYKYDVENYSKPNTDGKDYFEIFPSSEKKYHDFLLVDDIIDYSDFLKTEKNIEKKQRRKSYGKKMIGGIFKGVGKVGNSFAVLGKNIGNKFSKKKHNNNNIQDDRELKSENEVIKKIQAEEKDEDDLENDIVDNSIGNKYGYDRNEEFIMNAVFSQDIDGFWECENKKLDKIKEKYKDMNEVVETYLKEKNKNDNKIDLETIEKVKMTFNMIVAIMKDYNDKIDEFSFIIQKGKNYIKKSGFDFDSIVREIGVIFE